MLNKKNKLFLLSLFIFLFVLNSSFALAAFEVSDYPKIPGVKSPIEGSLETYIGYLFGVAAYMAGAIAVIAFAIGAVQLIMSAANPALASDAKGKMKNAVLGLILSVAAVVILQTINPAIVTINTTPLPETDGLFYTNGSSYKSAPASEANTANITSGYKQLFYRCSTGSVLLIWKFPKTNFEGNDDNYGGVTVVRKKCGESESLSGFGSFKTAYETPGIYYCMDGCSGDMCKGYMSEANLSSGILPDPFKGNLNSIRIVNDLPGDNYYGVIFHGKDDPTAAGSCSDPLFSMYANKEIECFNNISVSSSSTIFYWNHKDYKSSGQGIDFYSDPFGWGKGARAGKYSLSTDAIKSYWIGQASSLAFSYTGIVRPSGYKQLYQNFQQRSGSINVKGNYLVALWAGSSCQVFFKDVVNLKSTELTASGASIEKINVIPVK